MHNFVKSSFRDLDDFIEHHDSTQMEDLFEPESITSFSDGYNWHIGYLSARVVNRPSGAIFGPLEQTAKLYIPSRNSDPEKDTAFLVISPYDSVSLALRDAETTFVARTKTQEANYRTRGFKTVNIGNDEWLVYKIEHKFEFIQQVQNDVTFPLAEVRSDGVYVNYHKPIIETSPSQALQKIVKSEVIDSTEAYQKVVKHVLSWLDEMEVSYVEGKSIHGH